MKATRRFVVLCAVVLVSGIPLLAQTPSILEPKVERHQGPPLWISAKAVADEQKVINLDLIDSSFLQQDVERQRREFGDRVPAEKLGKGGKSVVATIPASECKSSSSLEDDRGGGGLRGTLTELATYAKSIVRGTVSSVDPGFAFGSPSSLVGVKVSEVLKGLSPKSPFYVDYPIARFRIGPYYFCNTNKGFEPRPGDEVLLFDYTGPADRDQVLYAPRLDQIFFQSQSGALFLPPPLKDTPDLRTLRSLDEVVDRLRSVARIQVPGHGLETGSSGHPAPNPNLGRVLPRRALIPEDEGYEVGPAEECPGLQSRRHFRLSWSHA